MRSGLEGSGSSFSYEYDGMEIVYGEGSIAQLAAFLEERSLSRAIVITGSHVGQNARAMDPVRAALGARLVSVFDGTAATKNLDSVLAGLEKTEESEADVIVALGSGSSLDIARLLSLLHANAVPLADLVKQREGILVRVPPPAKSPLPVVVVPTTLAGADLSDIGVAEVSDSLKPDDHDGIMRIWGRVQPVAAFYDPNLFASTPPSVLTGSFMNGFDKGIETLWSRHSNGITDATSMRGLRLMIGAAPRLAERDPQAVSAAVEGLILVQFHRKISIMHAVGHAFSRRYPLQQGFIHGVVAPGVMEFVLERVDGRRTLLAEALLPADQQPDGDELPEHLAAAMKELQGLLGFPASISGSVPGMEADFETMAVTVENDSLSSLDGGPAGLELSHEDIRNLLSSLW